jgi:hypothetical protein
LDQCRLRWFGHFEINTYTSNLQVAPVVAIAPEGDFVVVWRSFGSYGADNSGWSIWGQRYSTGAEVVFSDGFESGDTTSWSGSVQ